ncbi:MAG: hypothetical protein WBG92_15640 [Thiohalocapsa sp.]
MTELLVMGGTDSGAADAAATTRLHLALSTHDPNASVADYSRRLGVDPKLLVPGEYALWRTPCPNLSVRFDADSTPCALRHLGWEDPTAATFESDTDVNGILWERFSAAQQRTEMDLLWPQADGTDPTSADFRQATWACTQWSIVSGGSDVMTRTA